MLWRRWRVRVSSVGEREADASSLERSFAWRGGDVRECLCWQRKNWRVVSQSVGVRGLRFERSLVMREGFTGWVVSGQLDLVESLGVREILLVAM